MAYNIQETGHGDTAWEGPGDTPENDSDSCDSHRRRRILAAHHKDFIGEDPKQTQEEDETSMMVMGRVVSEDEGEDEIEADQAGNMSEGKQRRPSWTAMLRKRNHHRPGEPPEEEESNLDTTCAIDLWKEAAAPTDLASTVNKRDANIVEIEHFATDFNDNSVRASAAMFRACHWHLLGLWVGLAAGHRATTHRSIHAPVPGVGQLACCAVWGCVGHDLHG